MLPHSLLPPPLALGTKAMEAAFRLGPSAAEGQFQARRRRQRLSLPLLASRLAPWSPTSAHRPATLRMHVPLPSRLRCTVGARPDAQGARALAPPVLTGGAHTNTFVCRSTKLKSNKNRLHFAVPSSSETMDGCRKLTICKAQSEDSKGGGGFLAGFLIGGAIFGTLGYVFAPQISRTLDSLLDENGQDSESDETGLQRVPRRQGQYYDEGLEKTRQTLGDKISQLNLAIDKAASRLKRVTGNAENEAVKDKTEIGISSSSDDEHVVENVNEHGFVQGESAT